MRLALASIRKVKVHMLALAGFAALAAMMIDLGLVLTTTYPSAFDEQARAAKVPDVILLETDHYDSEAQIAWLTDRPDVATVDHEPVLWPDGSFTRSDGTDKTTFLPVFAVYDAARDMDLPQLRGGAEPLGADGIYMPYSFQAKFGYSVGDTFTVLLDRTPVVYTVRGFVDDVGLGIAVFRFYVDETAFAALADQFPHAHGVYVKVRLDDPARTDTIADLLIDDVFEQQTSARAVVLLYDGIKTAGVMMGTILAAMLLVVAALVGLVALVMVRFRVAASIEESMTDIGVLKVVGYTSGQVSGSLVGQFCLVAGSGALIGVGGSQLLLPLVSNLLEQESMRPWAPGFAPGPALVTFLVVTVGTLVVAGIAALRIRRLRPLTALRGGLVVHSFKRNHLPLATSRGRLTWLMAVKSTVQTRGQMVTVGMVVAVTAFMGVVSAALYENIGARSEKFIASLVGEVPDIMVYSEDSATAAAIQADLAERDDIRSSVFYTGLDVRLDGSYAFVFVTDDFEQTEGTMLYEGCYPAYDNEVVIGWATADRLGKGVGDTVRVNTGGEDVEYLVTGLVNLNQAYLTTDGARKMQPDFQHLAIYVYVKDPAQVATLIAQIERDWDAPGLEVYDADAELSAQTAVYGDITLLVSVIVLALTAVTIALVLFLVLSMAILRGRRGFGIQKAVGFTTGQLVRQVVMTYLPVVAVGAVVGGAVGHLAFPSVIDAVFHTLDSRSALMHAFVPTSVGMAVSIVVLAGVVATLVALRVRKISPRTLITE
ncbi:MAG: ABC transporter permease [Micrococcales bacterium]|nr:ABC transporter permease [Micrococcales bacterium]